MPRVRREGRLRTDTLTAAEMLDLVTGVSHPSSVRWETDEAREACYWSVRDELVDRVRSGAHPAQALRQYDDDVDVLRLICSHFRRHLEATAATAAGEDQQRRRFELAWVDDVEADIIDDETWNELAERNEPRWPPGLYDAASLGVSVVWHHARPAWWQPGTPTKGRRPCP